MREGLRYLQAWAQLGRISNLPTVWSNVLVGLALGYAIASSDAGFSDPRTSVQQLFWLLDQGFLLFVAVTFFYLAGMIMNDILDLPRDRRRRPHRPLPSGQIRVRHAAIATLLLLAVGLAALLPFHRTAVFVTGLGIASLIVLYNIVHNTQAWSAILLAAIRSLIYFLPAFAFTSKPTALLTNVAPPATLLAAYILLLSIVARHEETSTRSLQPIALTLPLLPLLAVGLPLIATVTQPHWPTVAVFALLPIAWLGLAAARARRSPAQIQPVVMMWLAGISLFDALLLSLLGQTAAAIFAIVCFALVAVGHRRIMGT